MAAFRFLGKGRAPAAPDASGTETVVVDTGPVSVLIKETGVVRPRQSVAVKSKVSGKVREVLVAEGDLVREGQLLAVVDPDAQASLTLSQQRLDLRRLKVELDQKERAWKRQAQLAKEGLVSAQLAEEAERDYRVAQNLFLQARTALNLLETEANQKLTADEGMSDAEPGGVTDYRILAPLSGIVSSVKVKPGEMATSGTTGFSQEGALLMEISDQRQLEVVVNVNEIDVPKLKPGMPAKVRLAAAPGTPIDAIVDRVAVAPLVEAGSTPDAGTVVVFPVSLRLPQRPAELRQVMSASVDITREERLTVVGVLVPVEDERGNEEVTCYVPFRAAMERLGTSPVEVRIHLAAAAIPGNTALKLVRLRSGVQRRGVSGRLGPRRDAEPEEAAEDRGRGRGAERVLPPDGGREKVDERPGLHVSLLAISSSE